MFRPGGPNAQSRFQQSRFVAGTVRFGVTLEQPVLQSDC